MLRGQLSSPWAVGLHGRRGLPFCSSPGAGWAGGPGWGVVYGRRQGAPCPARTACLGWGTLSLLQHTLPRDFSLCFSRVEEDLDQILNLGAEPKPQPKPWPKPKPPVAAKPALPRKPAVPPRAGPPEAAATQQQKQQQQIQAMDEMDILQYIRDHDAPGQAAPSLF